MAVLAGIVLLAIWALAPTAFVPQPALRGGAAVATAATLMPVAAQAAPLVGIDDFADMGSSISISGLLEPVMIGMVMGLVPLTILGLLVAAWLQFKKGPTLGL